MPVKEWLSREEALIGEEAVKKLLSSSVLVFGAGGVGSYAIEALARAGVGKITVVDGDTVSESNINRQLIADTSTVGLKKAEVSSERIKRINPECDAVAVSLFADGTNTEKIIKNASPDFIVDAIDTVSSKLIIAELSVKLGIPLISSMGTGNKLDPSAFEITDIKKTSVCPLARVMRRELKARGIVSLPVLYSREEPVKLGSRTPASISFVPSSAGLMIAGYVINELIAM